MTYRSAGEEVAEKTKHFHDDIHLGISQQTEQIITAEGTQYLRPQLLLTAECHVLDTHNRQSAKQITSEDFQSVNQSFNPLTDRSITDH